ncbi:Ig-like domain-containing protein [Bradyrhizobium elkanii]|uniref:GLUG motif-containing protein n=1 Tax=Bradyrhizobium elkanii TaxID=29448 RepID=UPI0027122090|nr:GLUG motif-containing protein [Bradyrhizobium elkanii]WLA38489.1 Ig-like domain-containing protein [Bradyrhizobium elkanii]
MSVPTTFTYLNASSALYTQNRVSAPVGSGLVLLEASPASQLADGFFAEAFQDLYGNIIIAYQGSILDKSDSLYNTPYGSASRLADGAILAGGNPPGVFDDALAFALNVKNTYGSHDIYVTGHSLGGVEAEYAAEQFSFIKGGATFGAPGLPLYFGSTIETFTNYVDRADPVGNYASDAGSALNAVAADGLMGTHFGQVVQVSSGLNSQADAAQLAADNHDSFLPDVLSLIIDYGLGLPNPFIALMQTNHPLSHYYADFDAPIIINTLGDLEAVRNNLSGHYILGANIDASGIPFASIGSSTNPFTGTFDGNGHTINGLHVVGNGIYVGLFAEVGGGGKISNLGLTSLSVSAPRGYDVGGLAGRNVGTIENSYTTGTISGIAGNFVSGLNGIAIGGVAGWNFGTIKDSYSTAAVTSDTTSFVDLGGLAGGNSGTIDHSHANGTISGHSGAYGTGLVEIGGLVGSLGFGATGGLIENAYATGQVVSTGSNTAAGGLVGESVGNSTVVQSYATGSVSAGGPSWVGGLEGILFSGTISQSFATGAAIVGAYGDAGGLVGAMNSGTIFQSYARGAATGTASSDEAGLVAHAYGGAISQSYATGKVTAVGSFAIAGGLAAESSAFTTSSYWDYQSTGQLRSAGGVPEPTFFLRTGFLPVGFDPAAWAENAFLNGGYPYLRSIPLSSVIGGKIAGAIVFADANNNGTLDPEESFTVTNDKGDFEPIGGTGPLVAYGGTDTFTGLSFKGILEAPAGSTKISPISTLVSLLQNQGVSTAEQQVLSAFSINPTVDLTTFDPIAELLANNVLAAKVYSTNAEVMNTVTTIASALTGAGPITQNSVQVFNALAALINNQGSGPINLSDPTYTTQLLTAAAAALNHPLDPTLTSSVASIIVAGNSILEQNASKLIGQDLIDAVSDIERIEQGAVSDALQKIAGDPGFLDIVVNTFTGSNLTNALAPQFNDGNHAPWLATDTVASHSITEIAGKSGSNDLDATGGKLLFTDADLSDTHQVSAALDQSSIKWMNADGTASSTTLSIGTSDTLIHAIQSALVSDSTNGNIGEISWTFSAADHYFDFLAAGESLRATYNIAVMDDHGATSIEPVTIVINGTNDNPTANPDSNGVAKGTTLSVAASAGVLTNDTDPDVHDHLAVSSVNGTPASVGHVVKGTYGSLTLSADGSYAYIANKGALPSQLVAQDTFKYTVSDGHGGSSTSTLSIVVSNPDVIYQSGMNRTLTGIINEKNVLDGSAGHDVVIGGNAPDVLIGGNGDTLTGGPGPDTFVFRPNFGMNLITDFNVINEMIQFDKSIFSNVTDILNHTTNTNAGAVIDDGHGDTITLLGVRLSQLQTHQSDFHLV